MTKRVLSALLVSATALGCGSSQRIAAAGTSEAAAVPDDLRFLHPDTTGVFSLDLTRLNAPVFQNAPAEWLQSALAAFGCSPRLTTGVSRVTVGLAGDLRLLRAQVIGSFDRGVLTACLRQVGEKEASFRVAETQAGLRFDRPGRPSAYLFWSPDGFVFSSDEAKPSFTGPPADLLKQLARVDRSRALWVAASARTEVGWLRAEASFDENIEAHGAFVPPPALGDRFVNMLFKATADKCLEVHPGCTEANLRARLSLAADSDWTRFELRITGKELWAWLAEAAAFGNQPRPDREQNSAHDSDGETPGGVVGGVAGDFDSSATIGGLPMRRRISGASQVDPPEPVLAQMRADGVNKMIATVKMCLRVDGTVDTVTVLKSSGYAAWDQAIQSEVKRWRYEPPLVDREPAPPCTPITFVYRAAQ